MRLIAIRQSLQGWGWRKWAVAICAVVYLLYVALSYLYLPGKLKVVVQTDVAKSLGRDIRVQHIAFNPFTLSFTVDQFAIVDRPELPLVAWNRLFVNFDAWGSLFGWKIRFSRVRLDTPRIAIERRKDDFNFSNIIARFAKDKPTQSKSSSAMALQIDDVKILAGQFAFDDVSGAKPAHSKIDNISVEVRNLYLATGDDKLNPIRLHAVMPRGGQLNLQGDYRADPLKVKASIQAEDIHLEALKDFIANQIPVQLNSGRLALQTDIDVEMDKTFQLLIQNGRFTVTDLMLDDTRQDPPLLRGRQVQVQGIGVNLAQRRFRVEGITLDGFSTDQWLDRGGRMRIQPLLGRQSEDADTAGATTANTDKKSWDFYIGKLAIQNSRIGFSDRRNDLNANQQIQDLNIYLSDIRLNRGAQIPLQLSAKLNNAGDLNADGRFVLAPLSLDLHYRLHALALTPLNPYVQQLSWLRISKGSLNADGKVSLQNGFPLPLTLDLTARLNDLEAQDTRSGKAILKWQALQLDQLHLDLAKRHMALGRITLNAPDIAVEVASNKQVNIFTLAKPTTGIGIRTSAAPVTTTETADRHSKQQPWQMAIGQIRVQQGSVGFRDTSIKPIFKTGLYALDFELNRFASAGDKPATYRLASMVDKYAPFTVQGTLAPLQQQPDIAFTSQLRGLEMPTLSPYTGTYIGYNLKSGQLALDLQYEIKQHELTGKNNFIAKQLYLGDKVPSEQAVNLPVPLGLALLRDVNGVIDLDFGLTGDLNDPVFSVTGLIWKTLVNNIVKVAASPFQLLASLVGSSEDLGSIAFGAGDSELSVDGQARLRHLVKALAQRPQLTVTVHGSADATDDKAALQQRRVLEQIAAQRKMEVAELQSTSLLDDKDNRGALNELNAALRLPDERQRVESLKKISPQLPADMLTRKVYEQMLAEVTAKQNVGQPDLLSLADQRALTIKQFMVESAGLDRGRVQLLKTGSENLNGRICQLGVAPD